MKITRPLLAIVGPTASGKSSLAIQLAKQINGEIINCDSAQMYRLFDIGTGKLTGGEQQGITHHLVGVLDPEVQFSAGEYVQAAKRALSMVESRGNLPIIVGGTGLYFRALVHGLFAGPSKNPILRNRIEASAIRKGRSHLHHLLQRIDPTSAARIHSHDIPKLIRAIEVYFETKHPISELYRRGRQTLEGYRILRLGLNPPRADLYDAINKRTRGMFETGLVEEVQTILTQGTSTKAPAFRSLGYREALMYLEGKSDLAEVIRLTQSKTRQYAKRQITWFRKESGIHWFAGFGTDVEIQTQSIKFVLSEFADLVGCGDE